MIGKLLKLKPLVARGWPVRQYALACPPRYPPGTCACPVPAIPRVPGRPIPPADCLPPGPIAVNPCRPVFHTGHDTYQKYKYLFLFFLLPLIIIRSILSLSHEAKHKEPCREYEFMRIRSKRFPWGDGTRSFFHNDHVNSLPSECEPPPVDECDFD